MKKMNIALESKTIMVRFLYKNINDNNATNNSGSGNISEAVGGDGSGGISIGTADNAK